jgi:hypothetical protein
MPYPKVWGNLAPWSDLGPWATERWADIEQWYGITGGGPANLTRNESDDAQAVDVASGSVSSGAQSRTASDTAQAVDVAVAAEIFSRSVADTAQSVENLTRTSTRTRSVTDTAQAVEAVVRSRNLVRSVSDNSLGVDVATRAAQTFTRGIAEVSFSTDVATQGTLQNLTRSATDTALSGEVISRVLVRGRATTEIALASDVATRATQVFVRLVTDQARALDTATKFIAIEGGYPEVTNGTVEVILSHMTRITLSDEVLPRWGGEVTKQFRMKQGDLEPNLEVVLRYQDGSPINLAAAESVKLRFSDRDEMFFERTCSVAPQALEEDWGKVSYAWQAGDTDTYGDFRATWVITWPNTRPQTVPSKAYTPVKIDEVEVIT